MRTILTAAMLAAAFSSAAAAAELSLPAEGRGEVVVTATSLSRDAGGGVIATGRSTVVHGDLSISCAGTIRIALSGDFFSALEASGTVEAKAGNRALRAGRLDYESTRHLVTLRGNPEVVENGTTYRAGERILLYLETGVMRCEPKAMISVDRRFQKPAPPKPKRRRLFGLF